MPAAVPRRLRQWFIAHFVIDWLVAVPLFIAPRLVLGAFGWITVDPVSARLVAAALFAIGGRSYFMRHASLEVYRELLVLKVFWSLAATAGLVWSAIQGAPALTWAFAATFAGFFLVWSYWWRRLANSENALPPVPAVST